MFYSYDLTLQPGETQIVMHFGAQNADRATALAKAPLLADLDPSLNPFAGLSLIEISQIVNFDFDRSDLVVSADTDVSDGNFGPGELSLREAIEIANAQPGTDTITFDPSVFTGGPDSLIRLTQGELVVEDSLSIDGTSVGGVLITGDADDDDMTVGDTNITDVSASFGGTAGDDDDLLDDNSRVVNFTGSSGNLTLTGLTITGGRATGSSDVGGGIRFNSVGVLSLSSSTVSGNSSVGGSYGGGGGISTRAGDVSLSSSTVSGNSSGGNGGGISIQVMVEQHGGDNSSVGVIWWWWWDFHQFR